MSSIHGNYKVPFIGGQGNSSNNTIASNIDQMKANFSTLLSQLQPGSDNTRILLDMGTQVSYLCGFTETIGGLANKSMEKLSSDLIQVPHAPISTIIADANTALANFNANLFTPKDFQSGVGVLCVHLSDAIFTCSVGKFNQLVNDLILTSVNFLTSLPCFQGQATSDLNSFVNQMNKYFLAGDQAEYQDLACKEDLGNFAAQILNEVNYPTS